MKRSLHLILILALFASLFLGCGCLACADENGVILTLYVRNEEGNTELVKSYTADMLANLIKKDDSAAYVYYKEGATNAVVATEYVPFDDLLADAAVDFGPMQKLAFECVDGLYEKGDFSYETLSQRGMDSNGVAVPTAIALTWAEDNLDETTISGIATKAENTGCLRFVCGMTAEEAEKMTASGSRMPIDIISITILPMN